MYKTILVHVDATPRSAQRVAVAAQLAIAFEAHLIGAAPTGLSAFMFPASALDAGAIPILYPIDELRAETDRALDAFDAQAKGAGVLSYERRRIDDDAAMGIALEARYGDLVVISQTAANARSPRERPDFPQDVLLSAARPVLVLPANGGDSPIGKTVTVAWNGHQEALRAITSAIPLLKRATRVHLLVFESDILDDTHGEEPGADMALYLARHGVKVEVSAKAAPSNVGEALLAFAKESNSDLIVMGGYGHSRFREFLLGGATATALASSPLPLWMAH